MNKISYINKFGFSIATNQNENYVFSLEKKKILCLNKRTVEVGIGACIATGLINTWQTIIYSDLLHNQLYFTTGLITTLGMAGTKGVASLLLLSNIFQADTDIFIKLGILESHEISLIPAMSAFLGLNFAIGQSAVLITSLSASAFCLALLIKKFGNKYINTILNSFNQQQNIFNTGVIELKDNLKYKLSILGQDIFCLKKIVLQIGSLIGCLTALAIEASFEGRVTELLSLANALVGLLTAYKILGDKIYIIIPTLIALFTFLTPSNYIVYWSVCEFLISTLGEGMLLTGASFAAFNLLSNFAKKSKNHNLTKIGKYFDNKLIDHKKVIEHKKHIEDQKQYLQKRQEYINAQILINSNSEINTLLDDSNSDSQESKNTQNTNTPKTNTKDKNTNQTNGKQNETKVILQTIKTKKKYICNLNGKNLVTWNQLFNNNKSKPDNLTIKGTQIQNLITALGGNTKPGSKGKINVHFGGKKLDNYEVNRSNETLTSGFANRVKKAIKEAIKSGYINTGIAYRVIA